MEDLLHYVWKHRLFQSDLKTTDGYPLEVIDVGIHNTNAGADFFNAKIKIGDKIWAGNIEIHKSSSDWNKHKHNKDRSYNSVIMHVVESADCDVYTDAGDKLIQCEISVPKHIRDNVEYLLFSNIHTPCANYLYVVPSLHLNGWISSLLIERLQRKSSDIEQLLKKFNNSWDEVFYCLLCRSFGFSLNSDAFQQLAFSLPYICIQKQRHDVRQIEALLFGQAGMLAADVQDDVYYSYLQQEYHNLQAKYSLNPIDVSLFRKMRVRPGSSPHIRIAQLAALLFREDKLFSKIISTDDIGKIRLMLHENASEYWQTHYSFGEESPKKSKFVGDSSLDVLIINAVVPTLFSYGKYIADEYLCEKALLFLEKIKPENNSIVREFSQYGIQINNAHDSQATIQLKREYCEKRKCLFCRIGYYILTDKE